MCKSYFLLHAGKRGFRTIAMGAEQDLQNVPGVASQPDPATKDFIFQQVRHHAAPEHIWLLLGLR